MVWTAPATWAAGEVVDAAKLNTHVRDNLKAIGDPWTAYTPVWTSSGTAPSLGNGTLTGAYLQAGKLVLARIVLTIGSTSTVGTGVYSLSLPADQAVGGVVAIGAGHFFDTSASAYYPASAVTPQVGTGTVQLAVGTTRWSATAPVVPAAGDIITAQLCYEAA